MDTDPYLEDLMSQLGEFGRYQLRQNVLHVLSGFLAGLHMLSLTMVAPTPSHRCYIEEFDGNGSISSSPSFNTSELDAFIPIKGNKLDSCSKFRGNSTTEVEVCEKYVYDATYYGSSRVVDWDLVCDQRWQRSALQSIYVLGVLVGAIILGSLADKYGRKVIFYISAILQLVFGLACAFIPYYTLLAVALFFYGMFGSGGAFVTGYVLTMELVGRSKRRLCGTMFSFAFASGIMTVAVWASLIPDYRILQTILALHSLLLVGHWCLIDESIRWLWGQGRVEEAIRIVEKGVRTNGGQFVNRYEGHTLGGSKKNQKSLTTADLFRRPNMRVRMLTIAYCWFGISLVYYGLSFSVGHRLGNPFLMLFLLALADIPGYVLVIFVVDKTGRRSLCSALMFAGGVSCIVAAVFKGHILATVLVMLGKFAIAGAFSVTYIYTAEMFPTVVRNSAMGVGAMAARLSGSLTPFITLLDSWDLKLPIIIFGAVAITASLLCLLLPETVNKEMPQTLEDGENFGKGDTGYKTLFGCCKSKQRPSRRDEPLDVTEPLNNPHNSL